MKEEHVFFMIILSYLLKLKLKVSRYYLKNVPGGVDVIYHNVLIEILCDFFI